jgi:hypothetical protein
MKFFRAISRVKWLNVSKTISVLVLRVLIWIPSYIAVIYHIHISTLRTRTDMVFETLLFTVQPLEPADGPRELHYTQSSGKQQTLISLFYIYNMQILQITRSIIMSFITCTLHKYYSGDQIKDQDGQTCSTYGKKSHKTLIGKPKGKSPLGKPRRRWEDKRTDPGGTGLGMGGVEWSHVAQDKIQ